jgi:hypothetical protein
MLNNIILKDYNSNLKATDIVTINLVDYIIKIIKPNKIY